MARVRGSFALIVSAVACSNPEHVASHGTGDAGRDAGSGTALVQLATTTNVTHLVVDADRVVFTSCGAGSGAVFGVPPTGGSVETLATGACPTGLAAAAGALFIGGLDDGGLTRIPAGGTAERFAAVPSGVLGVAADAAGVYFTTPEGLEALPLGGGAQRLLAAGHSAWTDPVASGDRVFFGDPQRGSVHSVATAGGGELTLATGLDTVSAIAVAGSDVVVASGYVVSRVSASSGTAETIATAAGAEVRAVAADASAVYFASEGTLWELSPGAPAPLVLSTGVGAVTALATSGSTVFVASGGAQGGVAAVTRR